MPKPPITPKRLHLIKPKYTYIFSETPMVTYIVGGYLDDLWTYVGLCSLCR